MENFTFYAVLSNLGQQTWQVVALFLGIRKTDIVNKRHIRKITTEAVNNIL